MAQVGRLLCIALSAGLLLAACSSETIFVMPSDGGHVPASPSPGPGDGSSPTDASRPYDAGADTAAIVRDTGADLDATLDSGPGDASADALDASQEPCVPLTLCPASLDCGPYPDGCGGTLDCGTCPQGTLCGYSVPNVCGWCDGGPGCCPMGVCCPLTCMQLGYSCGPAGDGCGNLLDCGTCTAPQTCGGGGTPGVCGP